MPGRDRTLTGRRPKRGGDDRSSLEISYGFSATTLPFFQK